MKPALFIAVPKTASESMRGAMAPHGLHNIKLHDNERGQSFRPQEILTTFHHAGLPALIDAGIVACGWLESRWVFAFIRNPWDRMVSLYHYLFGVLGRHRTRYGEWSFAKFVQHVTTQPIDPVGAYNWRGLSQTNPQAAWLFDDGQPLCSFVGRFEHLARDWNHVCEQLGIDAPLPHTGKTQRNPYQEYYTPELQAAVAAYYASDITLGQYEFG